MIRTSLRVLAMLLLAGALEPCEVALRTLVPWLPLVPNTAFGQLADPGFGDPTRLTPAPATTLPPTGFPSTNGLPANAGFLPGTYAPVAPNRPVSPVRPNSWPGGAPTPVPGYETAQRPAAPPGGYPGAPQSTAAHKTSPADPPYDPAEILARVGSERIQACEILPRVNKAINDSIAGNEAFEALPQDRQQEEIYKVQREYVKAALRDLVSTKLLVSELRGVADAKMITENEKKIRDVFNNGYLKELQKEYGASSIIDLENKLRALGGSIESQRALFIEQNLAAGWLSQSVEKADKDPTHDEMLTYYRAHAAEWESPARARWEQLTAKWENFGTRDEAFAALAQWGDDVLLRGVPFAEVAKAHSQEYAADDGGAHDWATKGSLRSTVIDAALFSLPVGALSRILEDEDGCHIIRVLEREDAKRAPFTEVQPEIKQQLNDGGEAARRNEYINKLREDTPVWTVFDEQPAQSH